jgi:DnaJ domain
MDPHAVLGVDAAASADELTAAYRALAKRWHPDRHAGAAAGEAERRMAEINSAYELLRSTAWQQHHRDRPPPPGGAAPAARPVAGAWLPEATRRALGPEPLSALRQGEEVRLVAPVSAWASPQALLAVTDRRLLWLLDDAVTGRVRSLDLAAITGLQARLSWPRRRSATVRVSRRNGRRPITFGDLRPQTAQAIARLVTGRAAAA